VRFGRLSRRFDERRGENVARSLERLHKVSLPEVEREAIVHGATEQVLFSAGFCVYALLQRGMEFPLLHLHCLEILKSHLSQVRLLIPSFSIFRPNVLHYCQDFAYSGLEDTMITSLNETLETAQKHKTNFRTAAYINAITKIATVKSQKSNPFF
jgi:hypothetical protein